MRWIADGVDWLLRLVGRAIEAIFGSRQQQPDGTGGFAPGSAGSGLAVLALLVIVGGAAMWLLVRHGRRPSRRAEEPVAQAPVVDLASEDVTPDQLPEDEWAGLAQQWVEQGDFRMAARAVFMALLATLGRGGVISIRKAKSNGDYLREFVLRTRGEGALHDQFRGCIRVFEAAWYGGHELSRDAFEAFRMRAMSVRPHAAR
jgi:hypothetical protein